MQAQLLTHLHPTCYLDIFPTLSCSMHLPRVHSSPSEVQLARLLFQHSRNGHNSFIVSVAPKMHSNKFSYSYVQPLFRDEVKREEWCPKNAPSHKHRSLMLVPSPQSCVPQVQYKVCENNVQVCAWRHGMFKRMGISSYLWNSGFGE